MNFGNIGFMELMVILVIVLVLFGARRVPEIGASIGGGKSEAASVDLGLAAIRLPDVACGRGVSKSRESGAAQAPPEMRSVASEPFIHVRMAILR